jgi:hypothetical protein
LEGLLKYLSRDRSRLNKLVRLAKRCVIIANESFGASSVAIEAIH